MSEEISYFDEVEIEVVGGAGGNGMLHFHREKFVVRGGPDGGDGGDGGSVVLVVDPHVNTLAKFQYQRQFAAEAGKGGGTANKTGKRGADLEIKVPPGTLVIDADSQAVIGDLTEVGQRLVVAAGGKGGRGNARFATSRQQAPRHAERGLPGEQRRLRLELKLIADIGIIGVPNAGKSTLLSVLSNARPKIADYPFTTLTPNLGVANVGDWRTVVLADIPGLIEGAHMGAGLGFAFLRHIQRCRVLIHLLDGLSSDPLADYSQIRTELALFDDDLAERLQVVALNKMDIPEVAERYPLLQTAFAARDVELHAISAAAQQNVADLLQQAVRLLDVAPPPPEFVPMPVYRPSDPNAFAVVVEHPGGYRVTGERIEKAALQTYWDEDESRNRFQKILDALGIHRALVAAGIQQGDTVYIGEYELEWHD